MTALAWGLASLPLILAVYAYAVYPVVLWVLARRGAGTPAAGHDLPPLVTVVVPAYNEAGQIGGAIEAILAQTYPMALRQVLVLSDASTDATDDIVREYAGEGVELLRMPTRTGKTAAENAAVGSIRGSIVVNTDASVRLHPDAIARLVDALADPGVGVASTRDVSITRSEGTNVSEAGYVGYEMRVRALETRAGGIVGASGSGYAIRTALHCIPVRAHLSRDFSAALSARRAGLRAVSVDSAICFVPRTGSLPLEYRRKVRTIARGMETLYFNRDLLHPLRHRAFAWKLFSHKVCRWLVPLSVVPATLALIFLGSRVSAVWLIVAVEIIALGLTILAISRDDSRPLPLWIRPGVVGSLAGNLAVLHAAWRFVRGRHDYTWEPTRRTHASADPGQAGST